MKPARVLMTTDAVGGVWVYATALAGGLARAGIDVTLVTMGPPPGAQHRAAIEALPPGVNLVTTDLALEWMDPAGEDVSRARHVLRKIADRVRPDVVHLHGYREAAFRWPCPVVLVAHSCVASWWRACQPHRPMEPHWTAYNEAVAAGLDAADAWVAPSRAFRDEVQRLHRPASRGQVIHHGIPAFDEADGEKHPFILAAGRLWDAAKNVSALAAVAPSLPWPMQVAGALAQDRAQDHAPDQAQEDERTLDGTAIAWTGELSHSEMQQRMQRAAIFASPARYEPFGLAVLEAAASGCALVLSDIPTFRELWDGAAVFVSTEDFEALREALAALCVEPPRRHEMQQAARARARAFAFDAMLGKYRALYGELLAKAGSPAPRLMEACA